MSGGSWNYMYSKEVDDILNMGSDLEEMKNRLEKEGALLVANDIESLLSVIDVIQSHKDDADEILSRIRMVMKSLEWWDSSDWGKEKFDREVLNHSNLLKSLRDV